MPDAYASHLPVLTALSWVLPMKRVLEFGAGLHSTAFFLSLEECERLVSVETDAEWRAKVAKELADERLTIRKTAPSDLTRYDLVFVDDGDDALQREGTIRYVLSKPHPPVVVHDSEVPTYRKAIEDLSDDHFTFQTSPNTELIR